MRFRLVVLSKENRVMKPSRRSERTKVSCLRAALHRLETSRILAYIPTRCKTSLIICEPSVVTLYKSRCFSKSLGLACRHVTRNYPSITVFGNLVQYDLHHTEMFSRDRYK
jgi:hypothetical protein